MMMNKDIVMPMIVGSPRSGTTLLRLMLDSHPDLAIPPETGFLLLGKQLVGPENNFREQFFRGIISYPPDNPNWADFQISSEEFHRRLLEIEPFSLANGFRLFYRMYAERFGKQMWGDKTPMYCRHIEYIDGLLPEARFIHIVRDGRDAAVSLRKQWFSPGNDIEVQANYWRENVAVARKQGKKCQYYLEVRYEDLLHDPESILHSMCLFLNIDFHEDMLRYYERAPQRLNEHQTRYRIDGSVLLSKEHRLRQQIATNFLPDLSKIGVWKNELSNEECRKFEAIAGDFLSDFGYSLSR